MTPSCIIKDEELEAYLSDKLTSKPDYGYDTTVKSLPTSDWLKRLAAEDAIRRKNNEQARRGLPRR